MILAQTTAPGATDEGMPGTISYGQVHATGTGSQLMAGTQVPASQPAAPGPADFMRSYGLLVLMLVVLWVFLLRSGRGKNKKQEQMISTLKKGDEIQTVGGVLGKVVEVRDDRIQIKVDESANTKIWFSRSAIHRVLSGDTTAK